MYSLEIQNIVIATAFKFNSCEYSLVRRILSIGGGNMKEIISLIPHCLNILWDKIKNTRS